MQAADGGTGGAIVRFFRVKVSNDLIDAPVRFVLDWIVDRVEKKAKPREGVRLLDRDAGYPFCIPEQLSAMSGQRVLLLTHDIFGSLEGAFAGIADPAGAVMQHLRGTYRRQHHRLGLLDSRQDAAGERGGDGLSARTRRAARHVCHSRGGLITRAMLEHPDLFARRQSRFTSVGKAIFVAGACQGSRLATLNNLNRLLSIYSAIASFPVLGGAGVPLKVIGWSAARARMRGNAPPLYRGALRRPCA